jgi:transmembrane sensor
VTAVGTMFDVRSELKRVTVTVQEGSVDVVPSDASAAIPAADTSVDHGPTGTRLAKGETVTYTESEGMSSVEPADPGATEWISGRLRYRQVPLKYVAADVQRYINKSLIIVDAAAGELQFTGTIDQLEISDWLSALQKIFPLEVTQSADRIVIQSRAPATFPAPLDGR